MSERIGSWIQVHSGGKFYPLDPRPEEIFIEDIAHALANTCRFTGHVREFMSVAQHSVLVSRHCCPEHALWGLLHDAAEAYLVDLPRPLKQTLRELKGGFQSQFDIWEENIMDQVCRRFQLPFEMPESVKQADLLLLVTEARDLMAPLVPGWCHTPENGFPALTERVVPVGPKEAKALFLERFAELNGSQHVFEEVR